MGIHESERLLLGGILKYKDKAYSEIENKLKPTDFSNPVEHQNIFSVIVNAINRKEYFDATIVANDLKKMGISHVHGQPIFDYLESISLTQVQKKAIPRYAREIFEECQLNFAKKKAHQIIKSIDNRGPKLYGDTISEIDKTWGEIEFSHFEESQKGRVLTDGIIDEIEYRRKNPCEEIGYVSPYPIFNRIYGEFQEGEIYVLCARPGVGKSSWLLHCISEMAFRYKIPVLVLDTEMRPEQVRYRLTSSITKIPIFDLKHGTGGDKYEKFDDNPEYVKKWEECKKILGEKGSKYKLIHHEHAGSMTIDEVLSFVKHWRLRVVGRNNPCFVIYDYIKKTGEKSGYQDKEYQIIGDKTQKIKDLAEDLNMPILTAIQGNRQADELNLGVNLSGINASTFALSDKVIQIAAWAGSLIEKSAELMMYDNRNGIDWGTHVLMSHKARWLGKDWKTHVNGVQRTLPNGGKKCSMKNYLNFSIENFTAKELGLLSDVIESEKGRHTVKDQNSDDGDLL